MLRSALLTIALTAAVGSAAAHSYGSVDLTAGIPTGALQYGGWIAHGGVQTHTYLAPSYGECADLLQASVNKHIANAPLYFGSGHPSTYTIEPCSKRAMFELRAPVDSGNDELTVTVTVPARYTRELGDLRQRYRYDEYLADFERLFPAK